MAEQQSLLPWEEKFISGQMSPEELRERLGGGFANRVHELAAQYGQAGEDGEFSLEQFTPGIMEHISGQGTTQGTQRMDEFDADTAASEDENPFVDRGPLSRWYHGGSGVDNPFTATSKWLGRNVGAPVAKAGLALGDKMFDTHGAFNKREGELGLGIGEGTENATFGALGSFMPGAGKGVGVAAKASPGAIAKGLNALKNTFSKSAPKTGPSGVPAAKAASAAKTPAASGAVPAAGKAFDDPAAKAAAAKAATATEAEAAKAVAAKTATKEGAEEVAKKGVKEGAEEVAKKPSLLSKLKPSKGTVALGALTTAAYLWPDGSVREEKPTEDAEPIDDGTNTVEVPPAAPAAPAAPGAAPGVVVPGSPPAHNVAREQQLEDAERLKKLGRLPPKPIQDSHRTKAHGRAWEEQVKKLGDRLRQEDTMRGVHEDRMKGIYDSTGGRGVGAWDALDDDAKNRMFSNFNVNQGHARDRRERLNNIVKQATMDWIDGGMQGPQPSAAFVEPGVMAQQKFDKAGFHQGQQDPQAPQDPAVAPKDPWSDVSAAGLVGDPGAEGEAGEPGEMPEAEVAAPEQPFFSQDRGGISPEEFSELTGLKRRGTGRSQNADGTWNTIESDGAFERAGGMDSARKHLTGGEGVEGGETMMAALENFGPGSGEHEDHPSGVGRYTDQFGQQSMLGEGTVRLSPNDQEYDDANFESGDDALDYLNRFDQPDLQPQPAPPGMPPSSPRVQPPPAANRQGPRMPSGPQALTAAALMALSKKFKIPFEKLLRNKAAAQGLMKQGAVQQGVKSPLATKAIPKTPVPGPAISSPATRVPPGQPVRTAAPGGGTPAGPQIVTPKTPAPVRTPSAPQQQYVPRTGNPVATAPTSRLPGGAPAPRRRFDSPDELIKKNQQQFALN